MKKVFLTAAIAVTLFTGAFADGTIKVTKASYQLQNQLAAEFAGAENVTWSPTTVGQKADFEVDGSKMSAFFDNQGQYIGYTEDVTFRKLPSSAKKQIAEQYKGYMVSEVLKFQPNETLSPYERMFASPGTASYFVNLKSDKEEVLLKVTSQAEVSIYKQTK